MTKFNQIPGEPELWKVGDESYIVYMVPFDPPIPIGWRVPTEKDLTAFFGPGQPVSYDRTIDQATFDGYGVALYGITDELEQNFSDDPFEVWIAEYDTQAAVRPWLRDPEVMSVIAGSFLEGRAVTDAELQQTEWWKDHSDVERSWLSTREADPATANRILGDNRRIAQGILRDAGIDGLGDDVVNFMADQATIGEWSTQYFNTQVQAVADPQSAAFSQMDAELVERIAGTDFGTTRRREDDVKDQVRKWLGPAFGAWSDPQVRDWAGRLRNDPDAGIALEEMLSNQRLAMFPAYEDPTLTYEDVAAPWRQLVSQTWGQQADESDPLFTDIVKMNDATEAGKLLRKEGLNRGIGQVVNSLQGDLVNTFGRVRRPVS